MTSKWIQEVLDSGKFDREGFERAMATMLRVDKLLRVARLKADDSMYDKIQEEITGDKVMTGVSSVVPVTDEEAERIFEEVETIKFSTEELLKNLKKDKDGN